MVEGVTLKRACKRRREEGKESDEPITQSEVKVEIMTEEGVIAVKSYNKRPEEER